jgi:hypothetical protein
MYDVWPTNLYLIKYFASQYNALNLPLVVEICKLFSKSDESRKVLTKVHHKCYLLHADNCEQ